MTALEALAAAGVTVRLADSPLLGLRAGPASALTAEARALLSDKRDDILCDLLWPPVALSDAYRRRLGALPENEEERLW